MLVATFAIAVASASVQEPAQRIEAAVLGGSGLAVEEVERALRVRLPTLELVRRGSDLPSGAGLRAHIDLRRTTPAQVDVTVILSDGRGYYRRVETGSDEPARPVAGALALLLAAIEDDSVAPDERDVPVPPAIAADVPVPKDREVTCPAAPRCPEPVAAPAAPKPEPPRLELAPTLRSGATFGLVPGMPAVRGGIFGLGLDLRWRSGAIVAVDVQTTAATLESAALTRVRGAVGAGFGLRRGAFELPIVGMFGVEGWGVRGDNIEVVRRTPGGAGLPMLGAGLRLSPALRAQLGPATLRAGARLELWGSGEPAGGVLRHPTVARPGEAPLASLGGVELSLGLELAVWFAPRRRR